MSVTLVDVSEDLLAKGRERIETSLRRVVKKQFAEDQKVWLCMLTRSVGMCLRVCLCLCVVCIVCYLCTYVCWQWYHYRLVILHSSAILWLIS